MTAEQLLREPSAERSGPRSESPRSLSNEALMASLRPPADYDSSRALRRSMEPHLIEGLSWFLERAPWQRALLSTSLGALVGVGIVVTFARLFLPELGTTASAAPATSQLTALVAPAAATLLAPAAATPEPAALEPTAQRAPAITAPPEPAVSAISAQPGDEAPAATAANLEDAAPEAKRATSKAARKGKAAKRSKKAKQRARKTSSLPARWSELYARER